MTPSGIAAIGMMPSGIAAILLACHGSTIGAHAFSFARREAPALLCSSDDPAGSSASAAEPRLEAPPGCSRLDPTSDRAFRRHGSTRFAKFWDGTCWPLSTRSVASAAHPNGHHGARLRWQRVARKILAGQQPVSIVVLGGSMTLGAHSKFPWSQRLEELFNETGWAKVTVTNLARRGTTAVHVMEALVENRQLFDEVDLFLIDYAINDDYVALTPWANQVWRRCKEEYAEVLGALISLAQRPAVVNLETISRPGVDKDLRNASVEMEGMHWDVIQAHGVPTISYTKAVCECGRSFWMDRGAEPEGRDCDTVHQDFHHPGSITHDLIGQLVFAAFALEMEGVCKHGITGSDHSSAQAAVSERTKCLTNPMSKYSATRGSEAEFHAEAILGGSTWEFKQDVRGKPGWIAEASPGPPGELVFSVNTSSGGWLKLDYLASYKDFGDATIWLDAESPTAGNSCTLHSLWDSHSSQSRPSYVKVASASSQRHKLHIRPEPGAKFKLLGITSC